MSDFGIICEVNPLHGGHTHLLRSARAQGADRIVCVMSGNTVQRGEFAVADKYCRAEALLRCGADLVLELPFPWCSGSAETFARAGISVLRELCGDVIFGSECGSLSRLCEAAGRASDAAFRQAYHTALKEGAPAAQAYFQLLGEEFSSNDLLGIEYIRAATGMGASMRFHTVQRQGAGYGDTVVSEGGYPSAAAIRRLWREGELRAGDDCLAPEAARVFAQARDEGRMLNEGAAEALLLTFFRLTEPESLQALAGCEGGLANRLCAMARKARSGEELMALCRTKRYTDAHLRRVMLYCLAGVRKEDLEAAPSYTTLLAANGRGRALLSEHRRAGGMTVVTKPADAPTESRQWHLNDRMDRLYTLITQVVRTADAMTLKNPYIEP